VLCIALLASIETVTQRSDIGQDEWFRRGWTLQELLAPRLVVFVTKDWQVIGSKGCSSLPFDGTPVEFGLEAEISSITGIPERVLNDWGASENMRPEDKLRWMEKRQTSREEDMVYALFGMVGVTLSVIYGEGETNARNRLVAALRSRDEVATQQTEQYQKIRGWLTPPDPQTNHESARKLYERQTGEWLLETDVYQAWKSGSDRCLWLCGGAGCGKTILCSTVIENMRALCRQKANVAQIIYYFTFSDNRKQSYEDLLISLVAQIGWKEPGFSMLRKAYGSGDRRMPGREQLEEILYASLSSFDQVFCHLDALDECPNVDGARQRLLESLELLVQHAPNIRLLATSRDEPDIREHMERLDAKTVRLTDKVVDGDIRYFVAKQLDRIPKLSRLDANTKELVMETLTQKAGGM
jgi:hypothetical protein